MSHESYNRERHELSRADCNTWAATRKIHHPKRGNVAKGRVRRIFLDIPTIITDRMKRKIDPLCSLARKAKATSPPKTSRWRSLTRLSILASITSALRSRMKLRHVHTERQASLSPLSLFARKRRPGPAPDQLPARGPLAAPELPVRDQSSADSRTSRPLPQRRNGRAPNPARQDRSAARHV